MTDTASLELCKELYELTGWKTSPFRWWMRSLRSDTPERIFVGGNAGLPRDFDDIAPAYDLGWLVRKLPERTNIIEDTAMLGRASYNIGWSIVYKDITQVVDTPEDAVCKLLIAIVKKIRTLKA